MRRTRLVLHLLRGALSLALGCAHGAKRESASSAHAGLPWLEGAAILGEAVDPDALQALAGGPAQARIARLDHLLDLFDAARFAEDEYAREGLWAALGGHPVGIGAEATREATARLLQEALAIEAADDPTLDGDHRRFLTDAIMLLSVDLELPVTAEGLSIRTLAYRTLVEQGHPRIVGNARWRLYDHVRGTLEGAVEAPPEQRMEVAVQALYAEHDEVDAWLADTVPHARPPWPTPEGLWSSLQRHRLALARLPGWEPVLARRDELDEALRETVLTVLPTPRDPAWRLATEPAGAGREESLGPVLLVTEGDLVVDAGRPGARRFDAGHEVEEVAAAVRSALVQDGRGVVLLAAPPDLPSPRLALVLDALQQAQASRIEVAIREPRLDGEGEVVVALPLEVAHPQGERPRAATLAVRDARVAVHLSGRGPSFVLDGRRLRAEANSRRRLETLVRTVARAYPRERVVRLTLETDVMLQQLVELLAVLQGGPDRPFAVVGWSLEPPASHDAPPIGETLVQRRAEAYWVKPRVELEQAYPLHGDDQKRLEAFAGSLGACVPELEQAPPGRVRLQLVFEKARVIEVGGPHGRRPTEARGAALRGCVEDLALPFRLSRHRDRVEIGVTLSRS